MKNRLQNLLQDRKTLYLVLTIMIVSVFTLSIAYAAMSTALEIHGNSEVVASSWDIHLENVQVKSGSVATNAPVISGNSTLAFDVELNMPGEFYEFTVDVVNEGSIDAMIDSVVKTPELTNEQAKYIKYEITYENGESISTKQTLKKGTSTPIKVRVEYRKDIVASDLPSSSTELSLKLTLIYVQSDGTGTTIKDNGVGESNISANGSLDAIGTIVTIGDQQFYTIGTEGDNVKLLSMYNLYVGGVYNSGWTAYGDEATGKQDSTMLGYVSRQSIRNGTTAFSNKNSTYEGSIVEGYVNNYETILESDYGVDVVEARLITKDELTSDEIGCSDTDYTCTGSTYPWIYSTSYWSGFAFNSVNVWRVYSDGSFGRYSYDGGINFGVRPVIIISKSNF